MDLSALSYRQATIADLELTFRIKSNSLRPYVEEVWGWDENVQRQYHKKNFKPDNIKLLLLNNCEIGYLEAEYTEKGIYIANLLVEHNFQGIGLGTKVLNSLIYEANSKNKTLHLEVLKVNTRAKNLYERLGFKLTGENEKKFIMAK
ncbi:MAG TPA: GNAT family N-acetyltransferase [Bacteroidia bacterium]|jgi:ribosomal protein S18 acetylase RimI-like enzyme|nr:GNAT family N-acetyltransferase [Bacteroidia bacterium]